VAPIASSRRALVEPSSDRTAARSKCPRAGGGKTATAAGGMIAQSVADILGRHVKLAVEGIDRMYFNIYVPQLQSERGVVRFFPEHRRQPLPSAAPASSNVCPKASVIAHRLRPPRRPVFHPRRLLRPASAAALPGVGAVANSLKRAFDESAPKSQNGSTMPNSQHKNFTHSNQEL
jgi:hypothetical protein